MSENLNSPGALIDTRPPEEKSKDFRLDEIVTSINPVKWIKKDEFKSYPIFDQNGSGSCVAQTVAKMMGIMYESLNKTYVHFSATHVYQRRSNRPGGGMIGVNALQIATEGVTLEDLVPSQDMSDSEMDSVVIPEYKKKVGEVFKASSYVQLPTGDIDTIASVIQTTGKPVMVWFYFQGSEWDKKPTIKNSNLTISTGLRHSVTAVDFALVDGKKCLIIDDSWGVKHGDRGQRVISEEFFKARNWFSAYFIDFKFTDNTPLPPFVRFTHTLEFSEVYKVEAEVIDLQDVLKSLGFFPSNVESSGYYGAITAKAVYAFQKKYQVASDQELDELQGRVVGPKTIAKLNELV